MAGTNIDARSGETLNISFACKDIEGEPSDLTGYSARMVMRTSVASPAVAFDFEPTIPVPTNGVVFVDCTPEQTEIISAGMYYWDIVLDTPDDEVLPLAGGTIKFRQLVTR
jgi:hypothetical protein